MISQNFIGVFAPAGTPKPIVNHVAHASCGVRCDAEHRALLLASGQEPVGDADQ